MKKLLGIVVLGLLLSGCADTYTKYQEDMIKYGAKYFVHVKSLSTGKGFYAASADSYEHAENTAKKRCRSKGLSDCIVYKRGNTIVYSAPTTEDKKIAKAKNVCRKIGFTPDTDKFLDCTVKMLTTTGGKQTVIVGNRRTSIYPLHCRQMGGASAC